MDRVEALEILGINENEIAEDLVRMRYQRLVRRYPPSDFPDMAVKVHQAYQILQQSAADSYTKYLKDDRIKITNLVDALPKAPKGARADLEQLFRDTIEVWCTAKNAPKKGSLDISGMMAEMEQLFERVLMGL